VNRELVRKVDLLLGNEEDFSAMLGVKIKGVSEDFAELPIAGYEEMLREVAAAYPNLEAHRQHPAHRAQRSRNAWGAIALYEDQIVHVRSARSRSATAWAAATALPPASSTACLRQAHRVGRALRRGARRAGHDHSRRHQHGHAGRSGTHHQRLRKAR
jgi:hypothetical protein